MIEKLIFTHHALDRIDSYGVRKEYIENVWKYAEETKLDFIHSLKKSATYLNKQLGVKYYWANGFLFTVRFQKGKALLITLTQRKRKYFKFKT